MPSLPLRAAFALLAVSAIAPVSAGAATTDKPFNCEASALRGSVLGQAALEPAVANRDASECKTVDKNVGLPAGLPLTIDAIAAATKVEGDAGTRTAFATGGIANLRIPVLPDLGLPALPTAQIAALGAVTVPLPATTSTNSGGQTCVTVLGQQVCTPIPANGIVPTLPSSITLDLRPALNALLPDGKLPTADLLRVRGAVAFAGGRCADGKPQLTGASQVGGISVLGQDLPTDQAIDQALTLIDSSAIDPAKIDLSKITLPAGLSFTDPAVGTILQNAVKGVLASLPKISIPASLAQVKVTPGSQTKTSDSLTQQALRVQVSIAGTSVADVTVGEAKVSGGALPCGPKAVTRASTPTDAALQCTKRRLVLTDVFASGDHVRLVGAADRHLVGKRVSIVFRATGRRVATVTVRKDGSFRGTAKLPPRSMRGTNSARYQARVGKERSLDLKLQRRLLIQSARSSGGNVTLAGRVTRPLGSPVQRITLTRRISCKKTEVVKRFVPKADGTFRVTVKAPKGNGTAVYRLATKVRKTLRNPKLFPTFTLPRAIALR